MEPITEENEKILKLELRLAQLERLETCHESFIGFVKTMWP